MRGERAAPTCNLLVDRPTFDSEFGGGKILQRGAHRLEERDAVTVV